MVDWSNSWSQPEVQAIPDTQAAKPPLKKVHLHTMNAYDAATLLDLSAYPGLGLAQLLTLPRDYVIAHWNIT